MKKRDWKATFMMVWDIMFVLILCFVVLLTTMLVTKSLGTTEFTGYSISVPILAGVIISLGVYLVFMLKSSLKSLRDLNEKFFANHKDIAENEEVDA